MCWAIVLGNFLSDLTPHSLKSSWRFKSKAHPWDFRASSLQGSLHLRLLPLLLLSASPLMLSLTPGTFWPLPICQIFSLLHFKFLLNSLTHFLPTSWTWGPRSPILKLPHLGEKARRPARVLCSRLRSPGDVHRCTATWRTSPRCQDRSVSHYPRACLSFFRTGPRYLNRDPLVLAWEKSEARRGEEQHPTFQESQLQFLRAPGPVLEPTELHGRNSVGFQSPIARGLHLNREKNEVLLCKNICPW